jgi:hypothetical protein
LHTVTYRVTDASLTADLALEMPPGAERHLPTVSGVGCHPSYLPLLHYDTYVILFPYGDGDGTITLSCAAN